MSRTSDYDAHTTRIKQLRDQAVDLATLTRAYDDLAEMIRAHHPLNGMSEYAKGDMAEYAVNQSKECETRRRQYIATADKLEQEGIQ